MRPTTPTITDRAELSAYVTDYTERVDGRLGVLVGFPTGPTTEEFDVVVAHQADRPYASASVIKLPILYALYRRHDENLTRLDDPRPIAPANRVGGAGLLHLLDEPTPSLRDLARAMIAISDNAATNELVDYVGLDAVERVTDDLDMSDTQFERKMMATLGDTETDDESASSDTTGGESASSDTAGDDDPANTTSPWDCARLFAALRHGDDLSAQARTEQLEILGNQKDPTMFPRYFPYDRPVAHKTGWIPEAALDTGLLAPDSDRPLFFAVFCDRASHGGDATDVIAELGDATLAWWRAETAET